MPVILLDEGSGIRDIRGLEGAGQNTLKTVATTSSQPRLL
jgi:hypothetical protein